MLEQPTEAFGALHRPSPMNRGSSNELVVEPLVVPLPVIVSHVSRDGSAERSLSEQDQPVQTLALDREYESLGEGVQVGGLGGDLEASSPCIT